MNYKHHAVDCDLPEHEPEDNEKFVCTCGREWVYIKDSDSWAFVRSLKISREDIERRGNME